MKKKLSLLAMLYVTSFSIFATDKLNDIILSIKTGDRVYEKLLSIRNGYANFKYENHHYSFEITQCNFDEFSVRLVVTDQLQNEIAVQMLSRTLNIPAGTPINSKMESVIFKKNEVPSFQIDDTTIIFKPIFESELAG
ncbi:hypothetical protein [Buttiauxella brennerae]|uniref:hypothetical protein n=1 Tax=Buttiauxella brennerae TaxID=82988 RepID=UPI00286EC2D2|nr:hypothetical protein [Buttiauxella brennerae]